MSFEDSKAHYVVVTGIIIKDNKYLIAKRSSSEKVFPGLWTVPGGKLEQEDYTTLKSNADFGQWYNVFEQLLKREVKEEVGLDVKNIKYLTNLVFRRPDNIPVVVISLFADHAKGEVKLSDELSEHKWITVEEVKDYEFIAGIRDEIELLDKHLKGEEISALQEHD